MIKKVKMYGSMEQVSNNLRPRKYYDSINRISNFQDCQRFILTSGISN